METISIYVMSDIHGCYDELIQMIKKIELRKEDTLVLAGDYIDRGPNSYEMLNWIADAPDNVILLKGNHELEFAYNIQLMQGLCKKNNYEESSIEDTKVLYALVNHMSQGMFDYYGTIRDLIENRKCNLGKLISYADMMEKYPLLYMGKIKDKRFVVVHAGYIESLEGVDTESDYASLDEFYLYARDDAYIYGGIPHGIVVARHTPTVLEEELPFNQGDVYKSYDEELDCTFYDIDCGCCAREKQIGAKLACIRLDDEEIFYVR